MVFDLLLIKPYNTIASAEEDGLFVLARKNSNRFQMGIVYEFKDHLII